MKTISIHTDNIRLWAISEGETITLRWVQTVRSDISRDGVGKIEKIDHVWSDRAVVLSINGRIPYSFLLSKTGCAGREIVSTVARYGSVSVIIHRISREDFWQHNNSGAMISSRSGAQLKKRMGAD
jgi:hypothetical protein